MAFDYNSSAELFIPKRKGVGSRRTPTGYRLFATAAEAIRLAVEEAPPSEHSALGCKSEMSVSIAMRFVDRRHPIESFQINISTATNAIAAIAAAKINSSRRNTVGANMLGGCRTSPSPG